MIIVQLNSEQLSDLIQHSVRSVLSEATPQPTATTDQGEQLLTIQEAAEFLNLTVPTIYSKVSRSEIPVMKRSKRLYFSKLELISYLKEGRKKTMAETAREAELYCNTKKG
jgi:excisionase family DNA binding protein